MLATNRAAQKALDTQTACEITRPAGLVAALGEVIPNLDLEKGEFESSADYKTRLDGVASALNGALDGTVQPILFCMKVEDVENIVKYDADRQEFSLILWSFLTVHNVNKKTGAYQSTTRMGVKARVTSYIDIDYRVAFTNKFATASSGCVSKSLGMESVKFHVDRASAPKVKAGGYLAFYGTLEYPFFEKDERSGNPTLDDPTDEYSVTMSAKVRLSRVEMLGPDGPPIGECAIY